MTPEERLASIGLTLPAALTPTAKHVMAVGVGNLLFVSGHIARNEKGTPWKGRLGQEIDVSEGQQAARAAVLDVLATLKNELGDLSRIVRIVRTLNFVSSADTFTEQHLVANAASELLCQVLGDSGEHARSAIGVAQLPLGACFELEMIVQIAE